MNTTDEPIPFTIVEGNITALKVGTEIINTPPIPFGHFGDVYEETISYLTAKEEFSGIEKAHHIMMARFNEETNRFNEEIERFQAAGIKFETALKKASNGNGHAVPTSVPTATSTPEIEPPITNQESRLPESPFVQESRLPESPFVRDEIIVPHTMEEIIEESQSQIDDAIKAIKTTDDKEKELFSRIITPPGNTEQGKVNIFEWLDDHEGTIIDSLHKIPEFTEHDVKKAIKDAGAPVEQIEYISQELFKRLETSGQAKPTSIKQIADEIYEAVFLKIPPEYTDLELKEAIRSVGIAEEKIDDVAKELSGRAAGKAVGGFVKAIKKFSSRKPPAKKTTEGKKK